MIGPAGSQLPIPSPQRGPAARVALGSAAVLGVAGVGWLLTWLLVRLSVVTLSVVAALLLTALAAPLASRLRRAGAPPALAAAAAVLALVAVLGGVGTLVWFRASSRLTDLGPALAVGVDRVRGWLVTGPLGLDPGRVAGLHDRIVTRLAELTPSPAAGAELVLTVLGALVLVLFLVFFLLKDGPAMWRWVVERVPARQRERADGAGHQAWSTLSSYVLGIVTVAAIDASLVGLALFAVGVPLWLSLTLLSFFGAFVPYFGALVSGTAAVLVTLVSDGARDAVIILVVVLVVQQLEGNVLQPLVMRRAVHLHPVVTLLVITAGALLFGIAGAVMAVPVTAVAHHVVEHLRTHPAGPRPPSPAAAPTDEDRPADPDPGRTGERARRA